jgi:hypothetical protein
MRRSRLLRGVLLENDGLLLLMLAALYENLSGMSTKNLSIQNRTATKLLQTI